MQKVRESQHGWNIFCRSIQSGSDLIIYWLSSWFFKTLNLSCTLMPKTSISWKLVWIYLKSQIEFWKKVNLSLKLFYPFCKFISNMEPVKWCNVCGFNLITWWTRKKSTWQHSAASTFEIDFQTEQNFFRLKLYFQISKLDLRFQIGSNEFSSNRSFGHQCLFVFAIIKDRAPFKSINYIDWPCLKSLWGSIFMRYFVKFMAVCAMSVLWILSCETRQRCKKERILRKFPS